MHLLVFVDIFRITCWNESRLMSVRWRWISPFHIFLLQKDLLYLAVYSLLLVTLRITCWNQSLKCSDHVSEIQLFSFYHPFIFSRQNLLVFGSFHLLIFVDNLLLFQYSNRWWRGPVQGLWLGWWTNRAASWLVSLKRQAFAFFFPYFVLGIICRCSIFW